MITCRILGILGLLLLLGIWHGISLSAAQKANLVPSPIATLSHAVQVLTTNESWRDIAETVGRMSAGFVLASMVGILVGLIVGVSRNTFRAFSPILDFFRSTPVTSLYPVFVILLGVGHVSKIGMIFFACVFIIAVNAAYGMLSRSEVRSQMAALFGATPLQRLTRIHIFEALPHIVVGLRTALSLSLIVSILTEMFMGSEFGIGQRITLAFATYRMEELFTWILISGSAGYLLNRVFDLLEDAVAWWK